MAEVTLTTGGKPNERAAGIVARMDGSNRLYEATGSTRFFNVQRGLARGCRRLLLPDLDAAVPANAVFDGIAQTDLLTANRSYTLPSGADLLAALGVEEITSAQATSPVSIPATGIDFVVDNHDSAFTATLNAGVSGLSRGSKVVAANEIGVFRIVFTADTGAFDAIRLS